MPAYDATLFDPPAPVAMVTVRSPTTGVSVDNVAMLIDTGADVTILPRAPVERLVETRNPSAGTNWKDSTAHEVLRQPSVSNCSFSARCFADSS
jgi:hypothetical protein